LDKLVAGLCLQTEDENHAIRVDVVIAFVEALMPRRF